MPLLIEYRPICDRCQGSLPEEMHAVNNPTHPIPPPYQKHIYFGMWLCIECTNTLRDAVNAVWECRRGDRR